MEYSEYQLRKAAEAFDSTAEVAPDEVKELGEWAVRGWALNTLTEVVLAVAVGLIDLDETDEL